MGCNDTQSIFVSATPSNWELSSTQGVFVEQTIRPTGLIDPPVEIRPIQNQVDDLLYEVNVASKNNLRTLCTVLTKRMAEDLLSF